MVIKVSENLEIKPVSLASAKIIFESIHSSRVHLREWLPFADSTKNVDDTKRFIKSVLNSQCPKQDEIYEIWYSKTFAGLIGFKEIDKANSKLELGYWLDKNMTGKGIMVRTVKKMIEYVFAERAINRVMIKVATGNVKSLAIPQKLGFSFEGIERDGEYLHMRFHDLEVYSLLKKDLI